MKGEKGNRTVVPRRVRPVARRRVIRPADITWDGDDAWAVFAGAIASINRWSEDHGGPLFGQDGQHLIVCDRNSNRLLFAIPKHAKGLFLELLRDIKPQIRAGRSIRPLSENYIGAALKRHRIAENRRVKSNLRYERNHVATRRKQEAIQKALDDRLRFRARLENAAHELNTQLAGPWRHRDSLNVYDYRDMRMLYTWRRGLPIPVMNGHDTRLSWERLSEHERERRRMIRHREKIMTKPE